ncbi:hypothetical protein BKA93DRAFT_751863 [Sparassis latifolia]
MSVGKGNPQHGYAICGQSMSTARGYNHDDSESESDEEAMACSITQREQDTTRPALHPRAQAASASVVMGKEKRPRICWRMTRKRNGNSLLSVLKESTIEGVLSGAREHVGDDKHNKEDEGKAERCAETTRRKNEREWIERSGTEGARPA